MLHGPEKAFLLALFWIRVLNRVYAQGSPACLSLVAGGGAEEGESFRVDLHLTCARLCCWVAQSIHLFAL